ncbi:MBL fold metallo-hydrolase [Derxia gummosa]|uniref:MBL fold metallo-hydrolase n=1 Tax=Derxia gummosa DSM 723 TaxID=1121388 RepID=A0A8B6X361_9BURK|nr:MBL fold metallo-hydrolase [Derxia gummosa]
MTADIHSLFDPVTGTWTHVLADRATRRAAVIDPVLDFDPKAGRISHASAEAVLALLDREGLSLAWLLETHAHADHLSAADWLKTRRPAARTAIGARIGAVQAVFKRVFNLDAGFATDGSQFDRLLGDGDSIALGASTITTLAVPGHTPADVAYLVRDCRHAGDDLPLAHDAVFVGDTLFPPDVGSARCDFPGGDARQLYRSARRLLALPSATRLYVCHDYPPAGRAPQAFASLADQRARNLHLHDGIDEDSFVSLRQARDATLDMPVLLLPSMQVNLRAGALPPPESDGRRYLKLPLDAF